MNEIINLLKICKAVCIDGFPLKEWKQIDGRITSLNETIELYNLAKQTRHAIVEIGSFTGATTFVLCEASKKGNKVKVYAIDPLKENTGTGKHYYPNTFKEFKENTKKSTHACNLIRKNSNEAVKNWKEKIGVLFIDGDHSYKSAKRDFQEWGKYIEKGGYLCFHDFTTKPTTKLALEIARNHNYVIIKVKHTLGIYKKLKATPKKQKEAKKK